MLKNSVNCKTKYVLDIYLYMKSEFVIPCLKCILCIDELKKVNVVMCFPI